MVAQYVRCSAFEEVQQRLVELFGVREDEPVRGAFDDDELAAGDRVVHPFRRELPWHAGVRVAMDQQGRHGQLLEVARKSVREIDAMQSTVAFGEANAAI